MPRPKKKTALVEVIDHYLLGSDRIYQHILQDSMATAHGVIAKECTNGGEGGVQP